MTASLVSTSKNQQQQQPSPLSDGIDPNSPALEIQSIDSHLSSSTIDTSSDNRANPPGGDRSHKVLVGKSYSAVELPTSLGAAIESDVAKRRATVAYKPPAGRTESLPPLRSGLGLTNLSIEDVSNVSKLQMDQIWKEVECDSEPHPPRILSADDNDDQDISFKATPPVTTPTDNGATSMSTSDPVLLTDRHDNNQLINTSKELITRRNSTASTKGNVNY